MTSAQDHDELPRLEAIRGHRVRIRTFYDDEDEELLNYDFMKQLTGNDTSHFSAVKAMAVYYYNKQDNEDDMYKFASSKAIKNCYLWDEKDEKDDFISYDSMKQLTEDVSHFSAVKPTTVDFYNKQDNEDDMYKFASSKAIKNCYLWDEKDEEDDFISYDSMKQLTGGDTIHFNVVKPIDNKK